MRWVLVSSILFLSQLGFFPLFLSCSTGSGFFFRALLKGAVREEADQRVTLRVPFSSLERMFCFVVVVVVLQWCQHRVGYAEQSFCCGCLHPGPLRLRWTSVRVGSSVNTRARAHIVATSSWPVGQVRYFLFSLVT